MSTAVISEVSIQPLPGDGEDTGSCSLCSVAHLCPKLFATPWTAAHQASLSITNSRSLLKLKSIESVLLGWGYSSCTCPLTQLILSNSFFLLALGFLRDPMTHGAVFPKHCVYLNHVTFHLSADSNSAGLGWDPGVCIPN